MKQEEIKSKLDTVAEDITDIKISLAKIDVTLEKNTESLIVHEKRTSQLESRVVPIEKHVAMLNGALKLLGVLSLIVGLIVAISNLLKL